MKKKFDRFVLRQHLSEGPGGNVFHAEESLPGENTRSVALKILPSTTLADPKAQQRFFGEVKLLVALAGHPNIVTIYAIGETDGQPWMAMEWIPSTLTSVLRDTPAGAEHVGNFLKQIATALVALHGLNPPVLHNDLTPDNILVDRFGGYKISDFGLAGPATVERTRVLATVRYAAPELLSRDFGPLTPATDLYALGHMAFELALGQKLYRQQFPAVYDARATGHEGTASRWMAWHCSQESHAPHLRTVLNDFPEELDALVARLMEKDAEKRYPSAEALLGDLRKLGQGAAPVAAPAAPSPVAAKPAVAKPAAPPPPPEEKPIFSTLLNNTEAETDKKYFVRLGPKTAGPFDIPTLRRLAARGEVSRLHRVSADRVTWKSITALEGIF